MAAAAAQPVIGGLYDDFDDNRHEQLLLNDSGSTAGILYFTGDEVYKEYCSEMNAWVSPVATRNEYIQAKRMLESFTADLPDIKLVLTFLVNNYSYRIDELLVNYECILYDTKSAKFDFAFYYMVDCFLRTVEENAAALAAPPAAAAAAGTITPPHRGYAKVDQSPPSTLGQPSLTGVHSSGGQSPYSGGIQSEQPSPARSAAARPATAASAPPPIAAALASASENRSSFPAPPASLPPQPDPKQPNLSPPVIKKLIRYIHNLYKGPEELIFDEEITQFHIALLIKYMN
jgi:hypothetical protein